MRDRWRWALAAGFSDVVSSASVWCFADDEDRAWWGGLWADAPDGWFAVLHGEVLARP